MLRILCLAHKPYNLLLRLCSWKEEIEQLPITRHQTLATQLQDLEPYPSPSLSSLITKAEKVLNVTNLSPDTEPTVGILSQPYPEQTLRNCQLVVN